MTTHVHQFLCLSDNYGVLVHDSKTGATASIDAPEAEPIFAALAEKGWAVEEMVKKLGTITSLVHRREVEV